jgi:hypothetical protein
MSMFAPRQAPGRVLLGLAAVLLAGCSTDRPTEPGGEPPPTAGLAGRAVAVRVDVAAGTVTVLDRSPVAAREGLSFALLGANEISAATSNFFRSAVGQFTAKKVRIRFDVAITNRSSVALLPPTFPAPPAATQSVLLFPFATTLTGGNGAIEASTDWDGAVLNFFNDASCSSGPRTDCYRWEAYPAPFAPGTTAAARTVGFDVDPTVQSFTTYFVLAADLPVPGSISGTVSSPQRGPLGHVTVSLAPANRFTGTDSDGTYRFDNLAAGSYTVSLSGLPGYCEPAAPQTVSVTPGAGATVDFQVACPYIAFTSDRDGHREIYRMNRDGTGQTRLTDGTCSADYASWSPDGTRIAYSCTDLASPGPIRVSDIIVMNADGSSPVSLTDGSTRNTQPDWGPDGRIVFSSWRDGNDELYVMDADGTNPIRLTTTPDSGEFQPSWSGDGSRIAFVKTGYKRTTDTYEPDGNILWTMNADGSGGGLLFVSQFGDALAPAWSPVSALIAFSAPDGGCCPSGDAIFTKDAVTSVTIQLIDPQTQTPALAFSPEWSSDGTRIVFGGLAGTATTFDIYVMAANGGGITNLSNSAGFDDSPAWQP